MKPTPFSHSSLKAFETCAKQFHVVKVLKRYPFKDTQHTIYGKELHKAAEEYARDGVALPPQFGFLKPLLDALLAKPGRKFCEHEMAVSVDLKPCDFRSPNAWARGIADLLIVDDDALTAWVMDYKSGSDRYPDRDQLTLMSLLVFANFPHIRLVRSGLLFVVKDTLIKHKLELHQAEEHWWDYRERVARLEAAFETGVWNPNPSGLCKRHCEVVECEFCGRR